MKYPLMAGPACFLRILFCLVKGGGGGIASPQPSVFKPLLSGKMFSKNEGILHLGFICDPLLSGDFHSKNLAHLGQKTFYF